MKKWKERKKEIGTKNHKKVDGKLLRTDTFLPVVQYDTVSALAVAALLFYKAVDFPALWRREPLTPRSYLISGENGKLRILVFC